MRVLLCWLSLPLLPLAPATPVSFTAPTARLESLLPKIGTAFGESWTAGASAADDPVFIHVTNVTAEELREKIARTVQAEWRQLDDGSWTLERTPQFLRSRLKEQIARNEARIQTNLEQQRKSVEAQPEFNSDRFTPYRILHHAYWSLPIETLANMGRGETLEFSTNPNPIQERLRVSPHFNDDTLRRYYFSLLGRNDPQIPPALIRNADWQTLKVLVRVNRSYAGGGFAVTAAIAVNNAILDSFHFSLSDRGPNTTAQFTTANATTLPLSPNPFFDLAFANGTALPPALLAADQNRNYPALPLQNGLAIPWKRPISERLKPFLFDATNNEPTGIAFEDGLTVLAKALDRNVIASFQDISAYLALTYASSYPRDLKNWIPWAAQSGVILREEGNWITTPTSDPSTLRALRVDREALSSYLKDLSKGPVTLARRQSFFNQMKMSQEGWLTQCLASIFNPSDSTILFESSQDFWAFHRLTATLGLPNEIIPLQNRDILLATQSTPVKAAFNNLLFITKPSLIPIGGPVPEGNNEPTNSVTPTYYQFATEWMAAPFPLDASLQQFFQTDTEYLVTLKNPEATTVIPVSTLAMLFYGLPGQFPAPNLNIATITPITSVRSTVSLQVGGKPNLLASGLLEYRPSRTQTRDQFLAENETYLRQMVQQLRRNSEDRGDQPKQPPH